MENEIDALVRLFETKVGTDLETYTTHNTLWYTGTPVDMRATANLKRGRVWQWIRRHADGMSTGLQPLPDPVGGAPVLLQPLQLGGRLLVRLCTPLPLGDLLHRERLHLIGA